MNTIHIDGNLTRDCEIKILNNNTQLVTLDLVWNANKKDESGNWTKIPHYFNCKYFPKFKDTASKLVKGTHIVIEGKLTQETWESDGNKRSKVVIMIDELNIIERYTKQESPVEQPKVESKEVPF